MVIPYSYGGEKLTKIAEFPQSDDFKLPGGEHVDVGYRYKQFCVFWLPIWNYDGEWCGYINSERYVDIPKSKLEETAVEAKVTLPAAITLPIGPTLGIRIILVGAVLLKVWGWLTKKPSPASKAETKRESDNNESEDKLSHGDELGVYKCGSWILLVACIAKFAKLEGAITANQIANIESIFHDLGYKGEIRQRAIEVFNIAKDGDLSFSRCITLFQELYHQESEVIVALIVSLIKLAHVDGKITIKKQGALIQTCAALNCNYEEFLKYYKDSTASDDIDDLSEAYNVLGCSPSDSLKVVKERYRKLVKDFHPDTIASKELPEEFTKFAQDKFNVIQEAYQAIVQARSDKVS